MCVSLSLFFFTLSLSLFLSLLPSHLGGEANSDPTARVELEWLRCHESSSVVEVECLAALAKLRPELRSGRVERLSETFSSG